MFAKCDEVRFNTETGAVCVNLKSGSDMGALPFMLGPFDGRFSKNGVLSYNLLSERPFTLSAAAVEGFRVFQRPLREGVC
jgi:hypothetical protein